MSLPMISEPENYFRQFIPQRDSILMELEEEAQRENIPIVGPVVGELLYILARLTQAKQILELGTATGYSTIWLAKACELTGGKVLTIEHHQDTADRARANFRKARLDHRIKIRVGDARDELRAIKGTFDMVFIDIDKQLYIHILHPCGKLMRSGGLLVADNIGFSDAQDFNQAIFNHPEWRVIHLLSFLPFHSPERDGLCLALRT